MLVAAVVSLYAALQTGGSGTATQTQVVGLGGLSSSVVLSGVDSLPSFIDRLAVERPLNVELASFEPPSQPSQQQSADAAPEALPTATPSPTPTATPAPSRRDLCEKGRSVLYCIYTVQAGDTLSSIALDFGLRGNAGLSAAEMLAQSNKPDVVNSDAILPGQKLRIPVVSGIIHTVFAAETLSEVAADYGVSASSILNLEVNSIANPDLLVVGQEFIIPSPQRLPQPAAPDATPTATATATSTPSASDEEDEGAAPVESAAAEAEPEEENEAGSAEGTPDGESAADEAEATARLEPTATPEPTSTPTPAPTATPRPRPTATPAPKVSGSGFIWPASGPLSSYFGPSHPLGIDIDFYATPNQPVKAAAAGTVTFAGGDPCCSYGLYVIVDHGNGFSTLYAHLSRINVSVGQKVAQGEVLGLGGRTGYATGNHLHFEIRRNGAVVNPLSYLP